MTIKFRDQRFPAHRACQAIENPPRVKMMVVLGELGEHDEYSLVEALKEGKVQKPVVAWVSGTCARLFKSEVQFGHAVLALTIVSVGVAVAIVTDLEFHFFGACIASAWIIPSAVNKILWSNLQQQENWTALALMWKTTPITLLFLVALMLWLDPPGVLSFNWNRANTAVILLSAALGFLLQLSGALALGLW